MDDITTAEQTAEGDGIEKTGIEVPADGTVVELFGPDALDKLTDEQAQEIAGPPTELSLPTMELNLGGSPIRVGRNATKDEAAIIVGPILVNVVLPLDGEVGRQIAQQLQGGIAVASALPPNLT